MAVAIGVTRGDIARFPTITDYRATLNRLGYTFPVFDIDARRREDVKSLLLAMVALLDPTTRRAA